MKTLAFLVLVFTTITLRAQERPLTVNGKVVDHAITTTLSATEAEIAKTGQSAWIAYSVPVIPGEHHMCCFNASRPFNGRACCGGCRLEQANADNFIGDHFNNCNAEPSKMFFVLARVGGGTVQKIRPASADCELDLGGVVLYSLGEAKAAESVAWLSSFVNEIAADDRTQRQLGEGAISSIALHDGPAADEALVRFVGPQQPRKFRQQAAFWLGSARGQRGYEVVRDLVRQDKDPKFREEATFALSESPVHEAQQELVRLAHADQDANVRGQALFWLAQKAGRKVAGTINEAIENDPDTEVKKKAVFALSQMEDNQGVPLLITVAKNNRNPVLKQEALFWLGQSQDPRALDYIESVLK
jgi:HEAT repeat protein